MKIKTHHYLAPLTVLALIIAFIVGWVLNIIQIVGMLDQDISTMFVLKVAGVFFAPLGALLGYI